MCRQGLDGCPRKILAFLTSEYGSPKKWFAIADKNRLNRGYVRLRDHLALKMGRTVLEIGSDLT